MAQQVLRFSGGSPQLLIALAGAGWAFTYLNQIRTDQRNGQLARVNEQLRELYGPLLSCVTAAKATFDAMVLQHSPDGTGAGLRRAYSEDPQCDSASAYRLWVQEVFHPLNERAAELIIARSDLMLGMKVEPSMPMLVAHVAATRIAIKQWTAGDFSKRNLVHFPDDLHISVRAHFETLRLRQAVLLGVGSKSRL